MVFEFKLPDIGEGVVEGEVITWHRQEGEFIHEDDPLVEVMTDKATVTIPSPKSGVVIKLFYQEGDIAPVGELLVSINPDGEATAPVEAEPVHELTRPIPTPPQASVAAGTAPVAAVVPASPERTSNGRKRILATPATRKLARDMGVDIQGVSGSGTAGRITREDVLAYAESAPATPAAVQSMAAPVTPSISSPAQPATTRIAPPVLSPAPGTVETIPIRGLRKRIFERMAQSKHTAAHFTYVDEVDMTRLVDTRNRLKSRSESMGAHLTFLPFFMKAAYLSMREYPHINATMDDANNALQVHGSYNFSIAVATDSGLTVPVVQSVNTKSIFELAQDLTDLSARARDGKLQREDFMGGTFTITSLGKLGGMFATPIVNYPEVSIIGIHTIEDRPVVIEGEIVVRKRMYLSASFDHRVIDGHIGAAFVQRIKGLLEDPDALLLELR